MVPGRSSRERFGFFAVTAREEGGRMLVTEKSKFIATDLSPRIGTAIKTDVGTLLSGAIAKDIRALMEERGVIAFPEINLTDEQQVAFTKTLGTFAHEDGEGEGVYKITMDTRENANADYLKGAFYWHIDGTMSRIPILAVARRGRDRVLQHLRRL
jgi:Taurine catabolism dioxygenase TauD, TfdA family